MRIAATQNVSTRSAAARGLLALLCVLALFTLTATSASAATLALQLRSRASSSSSTTVTASPSLSEPVAESVLTGPFQVSYTLPEAPLAGSVELVFESEAGGPLKLVLQEGEAGTHTVEVEPLKPAAAAGVLSAPSELPAGTYSLSISYQDDLGNPAAHSTPISITLHHPLCIPGRFSESGEAPCELAPPGHYTAEAGATAALPCQPGTFAASYGSDECAKAPPGAYIDRTGASSATPCPAGSYSSEPGSVQCKATPPDTYSEEGASRATPCPEGTQSPEGASSCTAVVSKTEAAGAPSSEPPASGSSGGEAESQPSAPGGGNQTAAGSGQHASHTRKLRIRRPKRQASLLASKRQRIKLICPASGVVLLHVSAVLVLGNRGVSLKAHALRLKCHAGRPLQHAMAFKIGQAARALLEKRHARVILHVKAHERASGGKSYTARARLRGRR